MKATTQFYGQFHHFRLESAGAILAVVGAMVFLFGFGFVGLGRQGSYGFDFHVFHQAGEMLLRGQDFWRLSAESASPYSYPPHASIFIAVYGALPFGLALILHTLLNLTSLASMVYLANRWFIKVHNVSRMSLAQGLAVAVLIGNPFVAHVFFMGQLSIVAIASVLLSWHFLHSQKWQLSAFFLALATIKPQLSLLYVIWLLATLNFRVVFFGAAISLVMMIPAFLVFGPIGTFLSWIASLIGYTSNVANDIGAQHVFGVESALASLGLGGALLKLLTLSLALTCFIVLYQHRKCLDPSAVISFLFALSVLFIYAHDYDLACLGILYSFLVIISARHWGLPALIVSMSLLVVLFFPQRFVRDIDIPLLSHWRVLVVPICCYLALRVDRRLRARGLDDSQRKVFGSRLST